MVSFSRLSPPQSSMHLSCLPYMPHAPPIFFFTRITFGEQYRSLISTLVWIITQRVVVISYRRFGTTTRCVITQKSAVLIYFAAEAWNHTLISPLCSFLHSPVTSSLLGPNILLNTLFSNTPQPTFLPQCERSSFTPTQNKRQNYKRCVRKVMTLNAWLDNWQCCSHTSDTRRDIHSYFMISASFNSIALTHLIGQRVV